MEKEKRNKYMREYCKTYNKTEKYKNKKKEYRAREEVKERRRKYRQKPEVKERRKIYKEKMKENIKQRNKKYAKKYNQRKEIKNKINKKLKLRLKNDKQFAIKSRLKRCFSHAMENYTQTGKIMSSNKYGIDYKAIIEYLKPFPEELSKYHIDHIKPLCSFNLEDIEQIKLAFSPENHQWLLAEDNLRKGGRY